MEVVIDTLQAIDYLVKGAHTTLDAAIILMENGLIQQAYEILGKVDIDKLIDEAYVAKQITDSQIVDILAKRDEGRYKDPEVEDNWKALTEEEFEIKYPPPAE